MVLSPVTVLSEVDFPLADVLEMARSTFPTMLTTAFASFASQDLVITL